MKTKTSIIALLAIAGSSLIATAQEKGEGRPSPEERKAKMEERRAAWEALTDEEKEAKKAEMKAQRQALITKYDGQAGSAKNGKLDREEMKMAREAGEKIPMMRQGGQRGKGGPEARDGKGGPKGEKGAGAQRRGKGGPKGAKGGPRGDKGAE